MEITCQSCGNHEIVIAIWMKTTFKFLEDGSISILHVSPMESLEEKLANNDSEMSCKHCGSNDIQIQMNPSEDARNSMNEQAALDSL